MRGLVLNPLAILFTAACGFAICRALRVDAHLREMLVAATAILLASESALVPLFLTRHASQLSVSQAALVATMVQLFIAIAFAAVVIMGRMLAVQPFTYWLLAFYWVTLILLVVECVRAVRSAAPHANAELKP